MPGYDDDILWDDKYPKPVGNTYGSPRNTSPGRNNNFGYPAGY